MYLTTSRIRFMLQFGFSCKKQIMRKLNKYVNFTLL
jgi:hypothetical protein